MQCPAIHYIGYTTPEPYSSHDETCRCVPRGFQTAMPNETLWNVVPILNEQSENYPNLSRSLRFIKFTKSITIKKMTEGERQ